MRLKLLFLVAKGIKSFNKKVCVRRLFPSCCQTEKQPQLYVAFIVDATLTVRVAPQAHIAVPSQLM